MTARRRVALAAAVVLLAAGALVVGRRLAGGLASGIEQWCGRQLLAVANEHLGPTLAWERIDYRPPRSVLLSRPSLAAAGVTVIEAASALVGFARVPRRGEPVVIESVVLERPVLRLIVQEDGSLLGLSGFVKPGRGRALPDGGSTRLSDVLAIARLEVRDGALSYETPRGPPMVLRPLTFDLEHAPPRDGPGLYAFDTWLALDPLARLDVAGRLDLDTGDVEIGGATLETSLGPDRYQVFPPRVQEFLASHEIAGRLRATARGRVAARDPAASVLDAEALLEDGSISSGGYVLPLRSLRLSAVLAERSLRVPDASVEALGGRATLEASLALDGSAVFDLRARGEGLRIEETLREAGPAPRYAGLLDFEAAASGALGALRGTLAGAGRAEVNDGRLLRLRLLRDLLARHEAAAAEGGDDRGSVRFDLEGDRADVTELQVVCGALGIRGDGALHYDGGLDLKFTVGPLEALDGLLAVPGRVLSGLAGRVVRYQVTGTLREPEVSVVTLGIGGGKPARE